MTPAQADWLRKNRHYRALHQAGGTSKFVKVGILHADGRFELKELGKRPSITEGCFEVGVLESSPPGQIPPYQVPR